MKINIKITHYGITFKQNKEFNLYLQSESYRIMKIILFEYRNVKNLKIYMKKIKRDLVNDLIESVPRIVHAFRGYQYIPLNINLRQIRKEISNENKETI